MSRETGGAGAGQRPVEPLDILMVNWNGLFFLRHFLPLTLEFTHPAHQISIWDNASEDGSRGFLRQLARRHPGRLRVRFSRGNRGHGSALVRLLGETDRPIFIVLDCDAVPLREGWCEELVAPVRSGAAGAGIWFANYLHPACLCTSRRVLEELRVDIQPDYHPAEGNPVRDIFQDLTFAAEREGRPLVKLEADADGYLFDGFGQTYGDHLVYHHWFGTRLNPEQGMTVTPEGRTREGFLRSRAAFEGWARERGLWREGRRASRLRDWLDEKLARWSAR